MPDFQDAGEWKIMINQQQHPIIIIVFHGYSKEILSWG